MMRMKCGAYFVVMLTGLTPARAAEQSTGSVVRAIQITEDGGITRVTIEADGPLPLPRSASLNDPPRIYFDLEGVTHAIRGTTVAQRGDVVSRVRVALRTASPIVTRVVLDLTRLESYRVDTGERQAGRIRVIVGSESAIGPGPATRGAVLSPAAPVPANSSSPPVAPARIAGMPAPPVPAANSTPAKVEGPATTAPRSPAIAPPSPTRSPVLSPQEPRPPLPMQQVAAYRKQISGELARMEALRALVARIDAGENIGSDALAFAAQEFTNLRRLLGAVKPSAVLADTHDVLMTSCTFGAMASRLGLDVALDGNLETRRRAQSAAAGSLMLFDRACSDLGCSRTPR